MLFVKNWHCDFECNNAIFLTHIFLIADTRIAMYDYAAGKIIKIFDAENVVSVIEANDYIVIVRKVGFQIMSKSGNDMFELGPIISDGNFNQLSTNELIFISEKIYVVDICIPPKIAEVSKSPLVDAFYNIAYFLKDGENLAMIGKDCRMIKINYMSGEIISKNDDFAGYNYQFGEGKNIVMRESGGKFIHWNLLRQKKIGEFNLPESLELFRVPLYKGSRAIYHDGNNLFALDLKTYNYSKIGGNLETFTFDIPNYNIEIRERKLYVEMKKVDIKCRLPANRKIVVFLFCLFAAASINKEIWPQICGELF